MDGLAVGAVFTFSSDFVSKVMTGTVSVLVLASGEAEALASGTLMAAVSLLLREVME